MSRESLILFFGIVVSAVSHIGIPSEWKERVIFTSGVALIALGYSLRRAAFLRSIEVVPGERRADAFVEHDPPQVHDANHSL